MATTERPAGRRRRAAGEFPEVKESAPSRSKAARLSGPERAGGRSRAPLHRQQSVPPTALRRFPVGLREPHPPPAAAARAATARGAASSPGTCGLRPPPSDSPPRRSGPAPHHSRKTGRGRTKGKRPALPRTSPRGIRRTAGCDARCPAPLYLDPLHPASRRSPPRRAHSRGRGSLVDFPPRNPGSLPGSFFSNPS